MNRGRWLAALSVQVRAHRRVPQLFDQLGDLHRSFAAQDARLRDIGARLESLAARAGEDRLRLDELSGSLEEDRRRGGLADDAIARLVEGAHRAEEERAELASGLEESRRLSLRLGQLTELVFDQLAAGKPSPTV